MRLTTKGHFAVAALVDLATRCGKAPVPVTGISERQGISLSYLEQLFGKLRRHNIVKSARGPGGGYWLARPGSQITIADIIMAVDEPMEATYCEDKVDCRDGHPCSIHALWNGLNEVLHAYLSAVNLQQLVGSTYRVRRKRPRVTVSKHARKRSTKKTPRVSLSSRQ